MNRRNLAYAVLVVTSVVLAACSNPTAPVRNDSAGACRGGFVITTGGTCEPG